MNENTITNEETAEKTSTNETPVKASGKESKKIKGDSVMKEYKGIIIALIAGLCAIICVSIMSGRLVDYKQSSGGGGLTATGSASCDFEADLIVWRGSFSAYGSSTQAAYQRLKKDAEVIEDYLIENGVTDEEMVFGAISISKRYRYEYNDEGYEIGRYEDGYDLYQEICVTSNDVDKVDSISRDITQLIEANVEFDSENPEYYYTKLDELKLQLIEEATQNAKDRIDIMAEGTGATVDKLLTANLGVFQITAQNTNSDYSYGGTFNTSSRQKTASITVKLNYSVK